MCAEDTGSLPSVGKPVLQGVRHISASRTRFPKAERVTRAMAEIEGVRPMGTLGIILRATRKKLISAKEARRLVDLLVSSHNLRISVEVYQAVLKAI